MARSDWKRVPGESYRRGEHGDMTVYRVIAGIAEGWFFDSPPWARRKLRNRGPYPTAEAAMDYADKHYPMEEK